MFTATVVIGISFASLFIEEVIVTSRKKNNNKNESQSKI